MMSDEFVAPTCRPHPSTERAGLPSLFSLSPPHSLSRSLLSSMPSRITSVRNCAFAPLVQFLRLLRRWADLERFLEFYPIVLFWLVIPVHTAHPKNVVHSLVVVARYTVFESPSTVCPRTPSPLTCRSAMVPHNLRTYLAHITTVPHEQIANGSFGVRWHREYLTVIFTITVLRTHRNQTSRCLLDVHTAFSQLVLQQIPFDPSGKILPIELL